MRRTIIGCLLLMGLLMACLAPPDSPSPEETISAAQPTLTNLFAEANRLYDQLEANTPIEVAPANASAQTGVLTIPTLF
jgi:hypothetical protein